MTLLHATRSLGKFIYRQRTRYHNFFLKKRLVGKTDFSYTSDWVSGNTSHWQDALAPYCGKPNLHMLEIGSYQGRSSVWFLQNILTNPSASLTCVDMFIYPEQEPRFDHNIRLSGKAAQVIKYQGKSEDILPTLPEAQFDIIYVDGDHRAMNVLLDGMLSWRLLKSGGTLIFDDYLWELQKPPSQRPQIGIDLFLEFCEGQIAGLNKGYQVIVRKR